MSNTKPHQRVFALIAALLFLVTTVGVTASVIWQAKSENNKNNEANTAKQESQEDKLQGTNLENFTPVTSVDKIQATDLKVGDGEEVKPGATVTAHYTGAVATNGTIFQSSHDFGEPIEFSLNEVIKGWAEGVPGMKVGGTRRLVIPADLAYGATPPEGSGIPANAPLVFDIELTAVKNP